MMNCSRMYSLFLMAVLTSFISVQASEEKKKAEPKSIENSEWVSKNFKVPEEIFSVAIGKKTTGETFILAGGIGCVYRIDTTTGNHIKFVLPLPQDGGEEVSERIDYLKIVPHNRFIAQSQSHVRLCDKQGTILEQIEDTSHLNKDGNRSCFDYMDIEIDKAGTFLVCVKKRFLSITAEDEAVRRMPFGDGHLIQSTHFLGGALGKDKKGNLKIFCGLNNNEVGRYDVHTCTLEERIPLKNSGTILPIDDEHAIMYTYDDIKMASLKDGRCLYRMPTGTRLTGKSAFLSEVVDSEGRCIAADRGGAIKIWNLRNNTCKTISQLDMEVEEYFGGISHNTDHSTFQSLALNKRALGNNHFVSAVKDGTVKLWTCVKEAQKESDEAEKADFAYQRLPQGGLTRIVCDYVGSDADQALVEIQIQKQIIQKQKEDAADKAWAELQEQNRVDFVGRSARVGLD